LPGNKDRGPWGGTTGGTINGYRGNAAKKRRAGKRFKKIELLVEEGQGAVWFPCKKAGISNSFERPRSVIKAASLPEDGFNDRVRPGVEDHRSRRGGLLDFTKGEFCKSKKPAGEIASYSHEQGWAITIRLSQKFGDPKNKQEESEEGKLLWRTSSWKQDANNVWRLSGGPQLTTKLRTDFGRFKPESPIKNKP